MAHPKVFSGIIPSGRIGRTPDPEGLLGSGGFLGHSGHFVGGFFDSSRSFSRSVLASSQQQLDESTRFILVGYGLRRQQCRSRIVPLEKLLDEAREAVCERSTVYGQPEDSFGRIGGRRQHAGGFQLLKAILIGEFVGGRAARPR